MVSQRTVKSTETDGCNDNDDDDDDGVGVCV